MIKEVFTLVAATVSFLSAMMGGLTALALIKKSMLLSDYDAGVQQIVPLVIALVIWSCAVYTLQFMYIVPVPRRRPS